MGTEESDVDYPETAAGAEQPVQNLDQEQQRELLEQSLQRLPPGQRIPLVLYHFEEMSYEEIARQLQVSLGKVKTDIHRGREALRRKLRLNPEFEIS